MTNSLSRKIVSFLVVFVFLLSPGVFVGAQTAPSQIHSIPVASSSEQPTSTPLISSGAAGRTAVPLYLRDSNPECCNRFVFTPATIREMYNSTSLLSEGITGNGVTIAIVDAFGDPYIRSELQAFDQAFGLPNPPSFHVMCIDGPCNYTLGIQNGWDGEIALDV